MYGAILGDMIGSPYEFDKSPKRVRESFSLTQERRDGLFRSA